MAKSPTPRLIGAAAAAAQLSGWSPAVGRDALFKTYKFKDFNAAFGFMARTALMAEKLDHHPEWTNVYNRVEVVLTTHSAGGVTELDMELAQFMDGLAGG
jgi:4a-hydroxytetrahydrobiopterin dehydratase